MPHNESLKDYQRVRLLAIRSLFEIIEQSSEGTVIVDRDANIVWMNERYARRFGLESAAQALGRACESVIPGSLLREVVRSGRPILLDMQDTPKEPLVVMRLPIHDDAGAVIGAIGFALFDELRSLSPMLKRYMSMQEELASTRSLLRARQAKYTFAHFIGTSAASLEVKRRARRGASADSPVLLLGETGTGKELLARACHLASPRGQSPLMALNCEGLPESMAETELFGYGPGAFEGARAEGKLGLLELTAGGTLFLDGVGEMSPRLQVKLLRFLQDGCFRRVGSDEEVYLDVRVMCATQVDLSELCAKGEFRQDLYHRLNVLSLHIPPLRECLDGLAPLVEHFLDQASRQIGCSLPRLAPAAMERLSHYHWPGNVRQLENVLFQAVSLCDGGVVKAEHIRLPDYGVRQPLGDFSMEGGLDQIIGRFEKAVLERLYSEHPSSRLLGKRLGVSHTTIANKLREHDILKPGKDA